MKLKDWLSDKSIEAFAKDCGVHPSTAYRWLSGDCVPHPKQIRKIKEVTADAVTVLDFYPD
ncbi:helix-turn-helix domain-containing protein [Hymenobacter fodinae]|uniref:XRE family transcriptional regulator n=1 Tax=Hymenobacter fodinae TaxID=2510796 RepID=A0A4Z0P3B1_9BACT|nr:helix-turn-helix transcriptional regulator [Hymenobacter fodinae]TGE04649.1 hypothetical protein EU556_20910 [Hymenobacter fodinae]